jgi:hypothetical protein
MEILEEWLRNQSVPTVFLGVLLYGLWRAARWVGPKITALVDGHLEFLRRTAGSVEGLSDAVGRNTTAVKDLATQVHLIIQDRE